MLNNRATNSDYIAWNNLDGNELKRMREEAIVAHLKYHSGFCLEGLRKITKNLRIGVLAGI
jgi:hypothetical protein